MQSPFPSDKRFSFEIETIDVFDAVQRLQFPERLPLLIPFAFSPHLELFRYNFFS